MGIGGLLFIYDQNAILGRDHKFRGEIIMSPKKYAFFDFAADTIKTRYKPLTFQELWETVKEDEFFSAPTCACAGTGAGKHCSRPSIRR